MVKQDKKQTISQEAIAKIEAIRNACLDNAEDFIKIAKQTKDQDVDHLRYHLATLALEEIGKAEMVQMEIIANAYKPERQPTKGLDDHVRKLFWALWGPAFENGKITKNDLDTYQGLAKIIHENRLIYLYVNPVDAVLPKKKISKGEADRLGSMAEARLGMEKAKGVLTTIDQNLEGELEWFLSASEDPEKRELIFGGKSILKLSELKNIKKWIHWLKEQFDQTDEEIRQFVQKELSREKPTGEDKYKDKWKVKVRIESESHSIRAKVLNDWNNNVSWIQLTTDEKHDLICTFVFPRAMHAQNIVFGGWGTVRAFVVSLNIATRGFFWWHVPKDRSKYYEEIIDLENNHEFTVTADKVLSLDWKSQHLVLSKQELALTHIIFGLLLRIHGNPEEKPFNLYIQGLVTLSKLDIHFRMETETYACFYECLLLALQAFGDWDGKEALEDVWKRIFPEFGDTTNFSLSLKLGKELQEQRGSQNPKFSQPITLTEVYGIKFYCDLYLSRVAQKKMSEKIAEDKKKVGEK